MGLGQQGALSLREWRTGLAIAPEYVAERKTVLPRPTAPPAGVPPPQRIPQQFTAAAVSKATSRGQEEPLSGKRSWGNDGIEVGGAGPWLGLVDAKIVEAEGRGPASLALRWSPARRGLAQRLGWCASDIGRH